MLSFWKKRVPVDWSSLRVRQQCALLCGAAGVGINLLLGAGKWIAGTASGSAAITADACNNMADAVTSLAALAGFWVAGMGAGAKHPFGHGRIEWLMGLFSALAVIVVGWNMALSSWNAASSPVVVTVPVAAVLLASMAVKLGMFLVNRRMGTRIDSLALKAAALDSLSDAMATACVLLATLISRHTAYNVDAWCGVLVSLLILYAGFKAVLETVGRIVGQNPDPDLTSRIGACVMAHPQVTAMQDLLIHDYGFGRKMLSVHIEGRREDGQALHDAAEDIAYELYQKFGAVSVVQADFAVSDPALAKAALNVVTAAVHAVEPKAEIRDFRMMQGGSCSTALVNIALSPLRFFAADSLRTAVENAVQTLSPDCRAMVGTTLQKRRSSSRKQEGKL